MTAVVTRKCPGSSTPTRQHHWAGTVCRNCGVTRGRLSRLTDDERVGSRAVEAERRRLGPLLLDEAWQEAEAALPDGLRIAGVMAITEIRDQEKAGKFWTRFITGWVAVTVADSFLYLGTREGKGPTPAAALRALAAVLRERQS
jgi:hypothetical protein